jgi:ornithine cyclodeaminase/alanine dehydrogenase
VDIGPGQDIHIQGEEIPMPHETLLLSKKDVQRCLDMPQCLEIVEQVFRAHGEGKVIMPAKLGLSLGESRGWPSYEAFMNAMPAYLGPMDAAGLKWAGGWKQNPRKGLPYVMATILLIDPSSGLLLSVVEGSYITNLRTGAATGVAAKYLAKRNAKTVAIIGAGAQGRMQVRALSCLFAFAEVRVMDIDPKISERFATEMGEELGLSIHQTMGHQEAVEGADIVVTATVARQILVRREWVSPGTFIASVGSYPELDPRIVFEADRVLVDSWAQNKYRGELSGLVETGEFGDKDLYGEVGDVVAGKKRGRDDDQQIIVCCLIGMGSQDVGCAHFVYQEAKRRDIGTAFSFDQEGA